MDQHRVPQSASPRPSDPLAALRRSPAALAGLGIICGLGLTVASVTLVRAADDAGVFEMMRSDMLSRMARAVRVARPDQSVRTEAPRRLARPGSAARTAARARVKREARVAFAAANERVGSRRTVCVRTCDGYAFPIAPLGASRDLPAHEQACAAACPGASTALYSLAPGQAFTDMAGARSVRDNSLYGRLKTAFLYQRERVPACSCQGPGNVAERLPILRDPTLRSGDLFVDGRGEARAFAGPVQVPHVPAAFADYRKSRALSRSARAEVDRLMGSSQREAAAKAFERRMRTVQASLREVAAPAGSGRNVRVFQVSSDAGEIQPSGARIILIR